LSQQPKKEPFTLTEEEQAIVDETNRVRAEHRLPPLKPNEKLFAAARKHSENMAKQQKMEHVLDKQNPLQRVRAAGYAYQYAGENLAWNQRNATELLKEWMNSEEHKKNILFRGFSEIGIGVARSEKGEPYFTQVFGTPAGRR
jgi:uncharacterized protein YkwD